MNNLSHRKKQKQKSPKMLSCEYAYARTPIALFIVLAGETSINNHWELLIIYCMHLAFCLDRTRTHEGNCCHRKNILNLKNPNNRRKELVYESINYILS